MLMTFLDHTEILAMWLKDGMDSVRGWRGNLGAGSKTT